MREHIYVAQQVLGRKLLPGEIVHHLDGNKKNNNPSNLAVLDSDSSHKREHARISSLMRWGKIPRDLSHALQHEALKEYEDWNQPKWKD